MARAQDDPTATNTQAAPIATPAATALPTAENVTVQLLAPTAALTVGDPIELTLQVTHPAGTQVILPRLPQSWGDLEVQEQRPAQTTANSDGTLTTVQTFVVAGFAPGDFQTPPLAVTMSDGSGALSQALAAPIALTIGSVLAADDSELRDIKPQAELAIPTPVPYGPMATAAAVLVAAALAFLLWRRLSKRQPVDNRTVDQVAYDELARIGRLNLPAAARCDEHYALVADCLRTYLERQFAIPARDRTTLEITTALRTGSLSVLNAQTLVGLLADCDLVKFAKLDPGAAAAQTMLEDARRFVMLSTAEKNAAAANLNSSSPTRWRRHGHAAIGACRLGQMRGTYRRCFMQITRFAAHCVPV